MAPTLQLEIVKTWQVGPDEVVYICVDEHGRQFWVEPYEEFEEPTDLLEDFMAFHREMTGQTPKDLE